MMILLLDRNRRTCHEIRSLLATDHTVVEVHSLGAAHKAFKKHEPDLVLVKTGAKDRDAFSLLEDREVFGNQVPVIVLLGAGAWGAAAKVRRLGATSVLRWPAPWRKLLEAVASAGGLPTGTMPVAPSITDYENLCNLTELEHRLNREMKCFAGRNQVYIRSVIVGNGVTTKPRVSLKCPLRAQVGLAPDIYYEDIREKCCGDPEACSALCFFRERHRETDKSAPRVPFGTAEP